MINHFKYSLILLFTSCSFFNEPQRFGSSSSRTRTPSSYSFGGSCVSKGKWVNDAINSSNDMRDAIKQLEGQEGCAGLTKILMENPYSQQAPEARLERDVAQDTLNNVTSYSQDFSTEGVVANLLFGNILDSASTNLKFNQEVANSKSQGNEYGIKLLNSFLSEAPNYQRCLFNNENALMGIATSSVRIASSYVGGGLAVTGLDQTMTNLLSFLRNKRFANILSRIENSEYFMSLSCIIESTTTSYCNANDAKIMIDNVNKYSKEVNQKEMYKSPFEGYLVLTRDTDIVSSWLLGVMFGVEPKLLQDAEYKNKILDNVTDYLKDVNNLKAQINAFKIDLDTQKNPLKKRTFLLNTVISNIATTLTDGWGSARNGDVNFFDWTGVSKELLPYYLIGRDSPPAETTVTSVNNPTPMSFHEYVQYMRTGDREKPEWIMEFDDTDALFDTIKQRTMQLVGDADIEARAYFRKRFIIDIPNLVTETITSSGITVKQALKNILSYLERMYEEYRLYSGDTTYDIEILSFTAKTISDIKAILESFNDLQELVVKVTDLQKSKLSKIELDAEIEALATDESLNAQYHVIIDVIYNKFNVLLQRDTYLQNRIRTMVKFEYKTKIRFSDDLDEYQKYLMIIAGNEIIEGSLGQTYDSDPNQVNQQLITAIDIHQENLRALEELFSDAILGVIRHKKSQIYGGKRYDFIRNYINDSSNLTLGLYKPIVNSIIYGERYFYENFSLKKPDYLDDFYGSNDQLISRLCIQSLAFSQKGKFIDVCSGTVMNTPYGGNKFLGDEPLVERYDRLMLKYFNSLKNHEKEKSRISEALLRRTHNRDHVCGFRNFIRRNYVYNLLQSFQDSLNTESGDGEIQNNVEGFL